MQKEPSKETEAVELTAGPRNPGQGRFVIGLCAWVGVCWYGWFCRRRASSAMDCEAGYGVMDLGGVKASFEPRFFHALWFLWEMVMSPQPAGVSTAFLSFLFSLHHCQSPPSECVYIAGKDRSSRSLRLSQFIGGVVVTLQRDPCCALASESPLQKKSMTSRQIPALEWPNLLDQGSVTLTEAV